MTYLWSPRDRRSMRVRRNPNASLYRPVLDPDSWGYDNTITPNGIATLGAVPESAAEAVSMLHKAGTRGAVVLGAVAGLLVSSSALKGALVGGLLGYLGGKYIVGIADKALTVVTAVDKVEKVAA